MIDVISVLLVCGGGILFAGVLIGIAYLVLLWLAAATDKVIDAGETLAQTRAERSQQAMRRAQDPQTSLLRASAMHDAQPETLVRPAMQNGITSSDELLRSSHHGEQS